MIKVYVVIEELGNTAKQHQRELCNLLVSISRTTKKKEKDNLTADAFDLCIKLGSHLNAAFENVKELRDGIIHDQA